MQGAEGLCAASARRRADGAEDEEVFSGMFMLKKMGTTPDLSSRWRRQSVVIVVAVGPGEAGVAFEVFLRGVLAGDQGVGDGLAQRVQPLAAQRADEHARRAHAVLALDLVDQALGALGDVEPIELVVDEHLRHLVGADLVQHALHFVELLLQQRAGGVDHVQQQVGVGRLLQAWRGTPRPACAAGRG